MTTVEEVLGIIKSETNNLEPIFPRAAKESRQDWFLYKALGANRAGKLQHSDVLEKIDTIKGIINRYIGEQLSSCDNLLRATTNGSEANLGVRRAIGALIRIKEAVEKLN